MSQASDPFGGFMSLGMGSGAQNMGGSGMQMHSAAPGIPAGGFDSSSFASGYGFNGPTGGQMAHGGFPDPSSSSGGGWGSMSGGMGPGSGGGSGYDDDYLNDRPLLEELGIDFGHIRTKVMSVLIPTRAIEDTIMADSDMAGPIVFSFIMGFCLLLSGKFHFGYLFGFGFFGALACNLLFNLMCNAAHAMDFSRTFSVLGYCLLPIVILSAISVLIDLRGVLGSFLGIGAILWCTQSATRFFEAAMHMQHQRWLIAFPTFLLYALFALMTVF